MPLALPVLLDVALIVALVSVLRLLFVRRRASTGLERELAEARDEGTRCGCHVQTLSELNHALQSSETLGQAIELISPYLPRLFGVSAGALYLVEGPGVALPLVHQWGDRPHPPEVSPSECYALLAGHPYVQPPAPDRRRCPHLVDRQDPSAVANTGERSSDALCVPLAANGATLALLTLHAPHGGAEVLLESPYINSAIEQISLAIRNLKLRETLHQQSIRDPLTRLYNRRYLEESLQRELFRAERSRRAGALAGLAVLMIDVDHFKRCNDVHGHDAGDVLLAEIGLLLRARTRGSDIASRYGGEEFVLALADVTLEDARMRAEEIRAAVEALEVFFEGQSLPRATISVGVAFYPLHGDSPAALIRAADAAMYAAKHNGRNRVCVASPTVTE